MLVDQVLPDPSCTPGVIDERVTQENVQSTICVSGYTRTVRPSTSYTNRLKRQGILDYGYEDTNPQHYEEDHLVPLELGGHPTDPGNLWPEPGASPNAKDRFENALHQAVCAGRVTLADAQWVMMTDWRLTPLVLSGEVHAGKQVSGPEAAPEDEDERGAPGDY